MTISLVQIHEKLEDLERSARAAEARTDHALRVVANLPVTLLIVSAALMGAFALGAWVG